MKSTPKKEYYSKKSSPKNDFMNAPHNKQRKAPPKKSNMDESPKNQVREMFMNWFKKNNVVGQIMTKQDVVRNILTKLDSKQEDALEDAMGELKSYGIIEVKEDGVTLVLTQKGSDSIK